MEDLLSTIIDRLEALDYKIASITNRLNEIQTPPELADTLGQAYASARQAVGFASTELRRKLYIAHL